MLQEEAKEAEAPEAEEMAEEEVEARKLLIVLYVGKMQVISQANVNTTKWPKSSRKKRKHPRAAKQSSMYSTTSEVTATAECQNPTVRT